MVDEVEQERLAGMSDAIVLRNGYDCLSLLAATSSDLEGVASDVLANPFDIDAAI